MRSILLVIIGYSTTVYIQYMIAHVHVLVDQFICIVTLHTVYNISIICVFSWSVVCPAGD